MIQHPTLPPRAVAYAEFADVVNNSRAAEGAQGAREKWSRASGRSDTARLETWADVADFIGWCFSLTNGPDGLFAPAQMREQVIEAVQECGLDPEGRIPPQGVGRPVWRPEWLQAPDAARQFRQWPAPQPQGREAQP